MEDFVRLNLSAGEDFCHLLLTFVNSLVVDQAQLEVGPDLNPNCKTLMVFLKEF